MVRQSAVIVIIGLIAMVTGCAQNEKLRFSLDDSPAGVARQQAIQPSSLAQAETKVIRASHSDQAPQSSRAGYLVPISLQDEPLPPPEFGTSPAGLSLADLEQIAMSSNPSLTQANATVWQAN